jgi:hypothetical protein
MRDPAEGHGSRVSVCRSNELAVSAFSANIHEESHGH